MTEARRWTVHRLDDNGNRFAVRSFESEDAAKEHAAELESRGHKQLYRVSRNEN
ncbi:MAG: SPOR domain-containing protein [Planctomycetota bacterium]|nr:SPOR domain-containing protein [Planctomycetota bacterium]MDA1249875.1 SPOR domain-containing protein [Planctomycetota bacterium]